MQSPGRLSAAILVCLVACVGCGGPQQTRGTRTRGWYAVKFTSASLPGRRKSGAPWHTGSADNSGTLIGGLIGLAVGFPEVGLALGGTMDSEGEPEAPAPYVVLKIGGDTYMISPTHQTLSPIWQQTIALPAGRYAAKSPILIQIRDAIDDGVLGQREMRVAEFLTIGARTLVDIGEVASLDVSVEIGSPRGPTTVQVRVPSRRSLQELLAGKEPEWMPIPVWNADRITIRATGEVCPSRPTPCFGPEGAAPGVWRSYNYEEFRDASHASLVGVLPGQAIAVGAEATFMAEQSGFLLLFVNDTDEGNDEGDFFVTVTVEPPF